VLNGALIVQRWTPRHWGYDLSIDFPNFSTKMPETQTYYLVFPWMALKEKSYRSKALYDDSDGKNVKAHHIFSATPSRESQNGRLRANFGLYLC